MKKRSAAVYVSLIVASILCGVSTGAASAATIPATKSGQALEDTINRESARVAELKVALDPTLGITHTIKKNATGNDVKLLQQFLKVYGVYPQGLITGHFGPLTESAVEKFQTKESIDPVGIVGPKTRARIIEISQQQVASSSAGSASSAPEITAAVLTSDVAENGAATAPTTSFASTTPNIYAVLSLKNTKQDTEIAYVRYFGGTYVDSGASHPSRDGLTYFHFQWSLKQNMARAVGNYSLTFYVDGKNAKTIPYAIY